MESNPPASACMSVGDIMDTVVQMLAQHEIKLSVEWLEHMSASSFANSRVDCGSIAFANEIQSFQRAMLTKRSTKFDVLHEKLRQMMNRSIRKPSSGSSGRPIRRKPPVESHHTNARYPRAPPVEIYPRALVAVSPNTLPLIDDVTAAFPQPQPMSADTLAIMPEMPRLEEEEFSESSDHDGARIRQCSDPMLGDILSTDGRCQARGSQYAHPHGNSDADGRARYGYP